jgi:putative MFS transporter
MVSQGLGLLELEELKGFHRRLTFLSAAGMFLDGFDLTVIAVALPVVSRQWHIPLVLNGVIGASAVVGMLLGSLFLGHLTDRLGRRKMYLVDLVCFVVFAVLAAASQNVWQLIAFRFLLGIGIGADYPISSTLLAEFSPTGNRGRLMTILVGTWFFGSLCAYVVGLLFTPLGANSWRWMLLVGAVIALVVIFFRASIPESPRWLASQGRTDDATKVLRDLTGQEAALTERPTPRAHWTGLFAPGVLRWTFFVCAFWFAYDVAFYGITIYTPTILGPLTGGSSLRANVGAVLIALLGLVGAAIGVALVEPWGRRPLIITSFAGLTAALLVLSLIPRPALPFLVVLFAAAELFANMGPGVLDMVYPTELFPTSLRASGTGLATAVSRVGAILSILVFPGLVVAWGLQGALWLFTAAGILGLVVCLALAPETRGRVLEEISGELDV